MSMVPLPPEEMAALASRWARALAGDAEPLRELASLYWYGVYAWWRRQGYDREGGAAATVACFSRWLTDEPPHPDHSGAGRMREWLAERLAELAVQGPVPEDRATFEIHPEGAEQLYADEPPGDPDAIFQRRWALMVLHSSTAAHRAEYEARGEESLFEELLPFIGFAAGEEDQYATAGARMGRTAGGMRKAVFDFRSRHRELLRAYVADTVAELGDVESEMTALLCACDAAEPETSATGGQGVRPEEMIARAMQSVRMTSAGAGGWTPPTVEEAARLFPHYEVLGLLGRGGMGAVYKACQIQLDRLVAIKLLPLEISVDPDFAERFRREARAMAKLDHPNIISVYDFGTTIEGHLFFAMAYVEGANLHDIIHGPGLSAERALEIVGGVCEALAYAHGKGIVHRDIKPANVMVSREGQIKVADFGLARLADPAAEALGHTMTGTIMGTPDYMAPEQKRGLHVDHRADVYSTGVMLYEALCRETPQGIFDPPSARVGCDPQIDAIVVKAMQQAPERRFQSTQEMRAALAAARTAVTAPPTPPGASRRPRVAARPPARAPAKSKTPLYAGIGVIVIGLGAFVFLQHPKPPPPASPQDAAGARPSIATATKEKPFVNSLGQKFVPVPITGGPTNGRRILFCIWPTRIRDYMVFVEETRSPWIRPPDSPTDDHPAGGVLWNSAAAFCEWLTQRERRQHLLGENELYRLPSDHEWSCAIGLGTREDPGKPPMEKSQKIENVFPWGSGWPPPPGAGNFASEELKELQAQGKWSNKRAIPGYRDGYGASSPVGSFAPNALGLYDLGSNVSNWCADWADATKTKRIFRGGTWEDDQPRNLLSSRRTAWVPDLSAGNSPIFAFRCVIAPAAKE